MISGFGWAALALFFGYLALFFWGSALAAKAAGRPVWLFARAKGPDRLAAVGFRAAFALAFFGPPYGRRFPVPCGRPVCQHHRFPRGSALCVPETAPGVGATEMSDYHILVGIGTLAARPRKDI
jgi:hypothetical protein